MVNLEAPVAPSQSLEERPLSLQPGQRAPNFALPNSAGRVEQLYDRFIGNCMVLSFLADTGSAPATAALRDLEAMRETLVAAGAAVVAVTGATAVDNAAARASLSLGFPLYADPDASTRDRFTAPPHVTGSACTSFVLDRNQRVLAVLTVPEGHATAALAVLERQPPRPAGERSVALQAPVLLLPNVLGPAFCREAIDAWARDNDEGLVNMPERAYAEGQSSKPVHNLHLDLKKRRDHIADDRLNARLIQALTRHLFPELMKAFRFRVGSLERFCIGAYEAGRGDYFRPHRDNMTETTRNRAFAVSLSLNDDYQGGGVRFAEFSDDVYDPPAGGALVFSCSLLHEALAVTSGTRIAAFTFLTAQGTKAGNPFPGQG